MAPKAPLIDPYKTTQGFGAKFGGNKDLNGPGATNNFVTTGGSRGNSNSRNPSNPAFGQTIDVEEDKLS